MLTGHVHDPLAGTSPLVPSTAVSLTSALTGSASDPSPTTLDHPWRVISPRRVGESIELKLVKTVPAMQISTPIGARGGA